MRDRLGAAAYYTLNIFFSPVTLLGYGIWVGKALRSGRGSGVSGTAQGPLFARFVQHELGLREDAPARRLMLLLPQVPSLGLRLVTAPLLLSSRLTGHVPKAFRYPFEGDIPPLYESSARVTFFDDVVARHLPDLDQFVILGAGFDTRALRLRENARVRCFEVDAPKTHAAKREIVQKAGLDATGVTFVAADFEKEDWLGKLVEAGFDPGKKTLFLWEGVTMYLHEGAVRETLRKIATTARGSVVAFDYLTTEPLTSGALYWRYGRAATRAAGEPLKFGIDSTPPSRERLAALLDACGLSLVEQRTLGQETEGSRAWGGFAIASVR